MECQLDVILETPIDTRYIDTGGWTTEWDLQASSGALQTIKDLPFYEKYKSKLEKRKRNNPYKLWTRPTITWKLKYEGYFPRELVLDTIDAVKLDQTLKQEQKRAISTLAIGLITAPNILCTPCVLLFTTKWEDPKSPLLIGAFAKFFLQMSILLVILWLGY